MTTAPAPKTNRIGLTIADFKAHHQLCVMVVDTTL